MLLQHVEISSLDFSLAALLQVISRLVVSGFVSYAQALGHEVVDPNPSSPRFLAQHGPWEVLLQTSQHRTAANQHHPCA